MDKAMDQEKPKFRMTAKYKCRLCGEIFGKGKPVSLFVAGRNTYSLLYMEKTLKSSDNVYLRDVHKCKSIFGVGMADFIGYSPANPAIDEAEDDGGPENG